MKSRTLLAALLGGAILVAGAVGAWTTASQGASAPGSDGDTLTAVLYELTLDGELLARFSELEGIVSGVDADDLELVSRRDGAQLKLPAKRTPPAVTLRRGMTRNIELAAWHELAMLDHPAARKTVMLVAYNAKGDPVARYQLTNAWPSKLEVDTLSAGASDVLMETVTLVCESLQRAAI